MTKTTCPECGSAEVICVNTQYSVYNCQECGADFDEDEEDRWDKTSRHRSRYEE